jgi:hypothetical protein
MVRWEMRGAWIALREEGGGEVNWRVHRCEAGKLFRDGREMGDAGVWCRK